MPVRHRSSTKRHSSSSSVDAKSLQRQLRLERALRQQAEAKVQTLEWKLEAMEKELQVLRKSRNATEEMLQKEIRRLNKELSDRDDLLEKLREEVQWFRDNYSANNRSERDSACDMAGEENGRPLHNNRAERLLRQAVLLRKNSYGSGAQWSGELAAKLFSISLCLS